MPNPYEEPSGVVLFVRHPKSGVFDEPEIKHIPGETLYKIILKDTSSTEAIILWQDDLDTQRKLLNMTPPSLLSETTHIMDSPERWERAIPGKVVKKGNQWLLQDKITIIGGNA